MCKNSMRDSSILSVVSNACAWDSLGWRPPPPPVPPRRGGSKGISKPLAEMSAIIGQQRLPCSKQASIHGTLSCLWKPSVFMGGRILFVILRRGMQTLGGGGEGRFVSKPRWPTQHACRPRRLLGRTRPSVPRGGWCVAAG